MSLNHKQISLFIPIADWRRLRLEAARKRVPLTELCREWLRPHLQHLADVTEQDESPDHAA